MKNFLTFLEGTKLRLTKTEIEEKIERLKERTKSNKKDVPDIEEEIKELEKAIKDGNFKK